ncbi:MAG TPA: hypothetical protein VM124_04005 [Candidatus Limnocylindrales bacterium]|nr:hypothetical protein [Candidatus Limnocylindrales bacterium]
MATTKKSTKAKIKTTKKPAANTSKAARTNKLSVSAKVVKTPIKKATAPRNRIKLLAQLNLITAVLSLGLAVMAGLFMNQRSYQLFTGLLTRDELASRATTVFVPAIRSVADVELRWAVVATMVLSAILPLLFATRLRRRYEASVANKVRTWRWVDMAVVGALMMGTTALISGVQDIMTLKLIGGLVILSGALAWMAERQNADITAKPGKSAYILSIIAGALPWLLIATYAAATPIYGMVRNSWFAYALYGALLAGFIATAINLGNQLRGKGKLANYEVAERNYQLINLLTRAAFAVILITGLIKG